MWSGDEHIKPTAVAAEAYLGGGGHSVGMARTFGGQGRYYSDTYVTSAPKVTISRTIAAEPATARRSPY